MADKEQTLSAVREVVSGLVGRNVSDDELLISSGVIDSLSILKLVTQLEKRLEIRIPTDSVQPDDFDSVALTMETLERVARV